MKNTLIIHSRFTNQCFQFQNPFRIIKTSPKLKINSILRQIDLFSDQNYYITGFINYEAAPAFDPALHVKHQSWFPLCRFGIYDQVSDLESGKYKKTNSKITQWQIC